MSMARAPVLFVSHGAPTFALEPGVLGPRLAALGARLEGLQAVLIVSPHWQTRAIRVMSTAAPATMHDFSGFASELYRLQYPAPGHPEFAAQAGELLAAAGFTAGLDPQRALDHGAWVPLRYLFPDAEVPVFQVSMPLTLDTAGALRLGRALAPLRERGVMIAGSGGMTHNLMEFRQAGAAPAPYVDEFRTWVRAAVVDSEIDRVVGYRGLAPHAARAHPSEEHFLPLLVALGARSDGEAAQVIEGGVAHGMLSMESYVWGMDFGFASVATGSAD